MNSVDRKVRIDVSRAIDEWAARPPSQILDHGRKCCLLAKQWLRAMDSSFVVASRRSGPKWIRSRFEWGPSRWPIYWCEAIESKVLDCGALAAVARQVFSFRGLPCLPVQLIEHFPPSSISQWRARWMRDDAATDWIIDNMTYHEACGVVLTDSQIRVWDPTSGWWTRAEQRMGYGATLALRVCPLDRNLPGCLLWGSHELEPNSWCLITSECARVAEDVRLQR